MGTTASAKIIAIPIMNKPTEPATTVTTEAPDNASPAASEVPVPAPEPIATLSLRKVFQSLLARVTRDRIITFALACVSIGDRKSVV